MPRSIISVLRFPALFLCLWGWGAAVQAAELEIVAPPPPTQPFEEWLEDFRLEANARGYSATTLSSALDGLEPLPRVIELDRSQPEFTLTFKEYLSRAGSDDRIARGRRLLAKHRGTLSNVYREYGVPPQVVVALWGIETDFGRLTGGFRVVPALATLAHDGRRSEFFRSQLFDALTIIEQGHITAPAMIGSWAGAMGQCQFMPSSFLSAAVDANGDGRKDIWKTQADVFASAANLMQRNGWEKGRIWGRPVSLPKDFDMALVGLETEKMLAEWQRLGVRRFDGRNLPVADIDGSIIMPDGEDGPAFLVYDNFRAIREWNRSNYFALTVGYLSDRIGGKMTIMFPR